MRPQRSHQRRPPPVFTGHRGRRRRAWSKVAALTPTLLLPAVLAGASGALLVEQSSSERADSLHAYEDPRGFGASGQLPREEQPDSELLRGADDPRELVADHGPPLEMPAGELGIPGPMLDAYRSAADRLARTQPGCGAHWSVLASIGRIESGHARDGAVDVLGTTTSAILGPRLSGGPGIAVIPDTDGGTLDGDPVWDRAVGSMQFIPETWRKYAADGNDDGVTSPHNVHDAALSAGRFLCAGGADLRDPQELTRAVFRYNHSDSYVRTVLVWAAAYALGVTPTPSQLAPEVDEAEMLAHGAPPNRPEIVALPPMSPRPNGSHSSPAPQELPALPAEGSELAETSPDGEAEQPEPNGTESGQPEQEGSGVAESEQEESEAGSSESAESEQAPEVLSDSVSESLSEFAESQGAQTSGDAETSSEVGASEGEDSSSPEAPATSQEQPPGSTSGPPTAQAPIGHEPSAAESTEGAPPAGPPSTSAPPEGAPPASAPPQDTPSSSTPPAGTPSTSTPESTPSASTSSESPLTSGERPTDRPSAGASPSGGEQSIDQPSASAPPSGAVPPEGWPSGGASPPAPCDPAALEQGAFVVEPTGTAPKPGATPTSDARPGGIVFTSSAETPEITPCRVPEEFEPEG